MIEEHGITYAELGTVRPNLGRPLDRAPRWIIRALKAGEPLAQETAVELAERLRWCLASRDPKQNPAFVGVFKWLYRQRGTPPLVLVPPGGSRALARQSVAEAKAAGHLGSVSAKELERRLTTYFEGFEKLFELDIPNFPKLGQIEAALRGYFGHDWPFAIDRLRSARMDPAKPGSYEAPTDLQTLVNELRQVNGRRWIAARKRGASR
jgi:hypothetical protein